MGKLRRGKQKERLSRVINLEFNLESSNGNAYAYVKMFFERVTREEVKFILGVAFW